MAEHVVPDAAVDAAAAAIAEGNPFDVAEHDDGPTPEEVQLAIDAAHAAAPYIRAAVHDEMAARCDGIAADLAACQDDGAIAQANAYRSEAHYHRLRAAKLRGANQ